MLAARASAVGALALACTPLEDLQRYREGADAGAVGSGGAPPRVSLPPVSVPAGSVGTGSELDRDASVALPGDAGPAVDDAATPSPLVADAAPDAASAGPCSASEEAADADTCYLFASASLSWEAARDACVAWGGRLVEIGSSDEDAFLGSRSSQSAWIGLNDRALEGTFVWEGGGGLELALWGPNEPNDVAGADCVEKRVPNGLWYDQPCDRAKAYVCEKPL